MEKEPPVKVYSALNLIWIMVAITIIKFIIDFPKTLKLSQLMGLGLGYALIPLIYSLGILIFFIFMIRNGKNWARIIFLLLGIFTILSTILFLLTFLFMNILGFDFITINVMIISSILYLIAIILLFSKESSNWFKSMKKQ